MKKTADEQFVDYTNTYSFKHMKHSLAEHGIWEVSGEDSNGDLGGSHYTPVLGYFEGKLEDVIRYGVTLPNFWHWGSGGSFKKIEVTPVDKLSIARREKLALEKKQLEQALVEVNKAMEAR